MGQITTETIAMIRRAVDANQVPPLTLWEFRQLAFLAEKQITKASPLTYVQRRSLIDRAGDLTDGLNQDDFADEIVKLVEAHHGVATQQAEAPTASNAGERENFDNWFRNEQGLDHRADTTNFDAAWLPWRAWKTRAALAQVPEQVAQDKIDAERYRLVRRGQHWSVIDGIGNVLRGEQLDKAVDDAIAINAMRRAARTSGEASK